MKEQIKKAFDLAENEVEEKQIQHLKSIIKKLLDEKKRLEGNRENIDEQIRVIKQDIDDFKSGRLDKIKERHELYPYEHLTPLYITIINDNRKVNNPTRPWYWNYEVTWGTPHTTSLTGGYGVSTTTTGGDAQYINNGVTTASYNGTSAATFTSGTYLLSDGTITNL